ncbi:hypothetical protein [Marinobacter sp. AL4B]|uniref:hypothetical protein n=1 Tax=Marinobacter sp. AL4B TaxID=2871173 RepID=UPI001CAA54EE|nr:hypothetical protein [Marinobacter sp. AL4B]MBZ0334038.1 hypothetical protein [Marinobacter sp. AL4B]
MLKELWRKLGSEFLQTNEPEVDDCWAQGKAAERRSGAKMLPHITHTGEFHLERLNQLIRNRYDHTFTAPDNPAANDETLKDVISYASRIQDQDIQRELLLFYLNCSPVIQEYLRSQTTLGTGSFLCK